MIESRPLRRVLMLRAGETELHSGERLVGTADPPLTPAGRHQVAERRRQWEWADYVVTSPLRRATETAAIFAAGANAFVEAGFGPLNFGRWQGVAREQIAERDPIAFADWQAGREVQPPGGEALEAFRTRVQAGVARLYASGCVAPLVVSHAEVIREIVLQLSGDSLPRTTPRPSELVLLTAVAGGRFRLGRSSSDPEPLRSPLERHGRSGTPEWRAERSVGHFELRTPTP